MSQEDLASVCQTAGPYVQVCKQVPVIGEVCGAAEVICQGVNALKGFLPFLG